MARSEERRHRTRLLRDEHVVVKITASPESPALVGISVQCSTVDISAEGLRLLLECPLVAGSHLALEVDMSDSGEKYFLGGKVAWSRETEAAGIYLVGVQLLDDAVFQLERWRGLFL